MEKPLYVCAVPHADQKINLAYELFTEGFTHKLGQDYVSFTTMIQRRYIAILQCAAVAIGVPALFSEKKLHAFRVQCTNVLGSTGASEAEREAHIGWQSTVQSRHYASLKHTAMNARTGHLLAGRSGRDDPAHAMWQCLSQAPGDGYWQRVRCLAAAAGYVTGVEVPDSQFQKLVTECVAAGRQPRARGFAHVPAQASQAARARAMRLCSRRSAAAPRTPRWN